MSDAHDDVTMLLNVDLIIHVKSGMKLLLDSFGTSVVVLNNDPEDEHASLELADSQPHSVDDAVMSYCKLVKALPDTPRKIWNSAECRCMDIGIQSGNFPHQEMFQLSLKTISELAEIQAEVTFTVYGANRVKR